MNLHATKAFAQAIEDEPYKFPAERAVIGACLIDPTKLAEVRAKLVRDDFQGPLHRSIIGVMLGFHEEGRKASVESISDVLGDQEVVPGLTVRGYLRGVLSNQIDYLLTPIADSIETVADHARWQRICDIADHLRNVEAIGSQSVQAAATEAISRLDEVLISLRAGKRKSYDAAEAAQSAIDLIGNDRARLATTGLSDLDRVIGGWPRGQLTILAGRPGSGKSAVATSCVLQSAMAGNPVLFFSIEMMGEQLGSRLLTDLSFIHDAPIFYKDILMRRDMGNGVRARLEAARERLVGLPIRIEEQRPLNIAEIATRSQKHAAELERSGQKLEVIFVDHIGLVRASDRHNGRRDREIAEITDGLAALAKDLDVAVVGLCQLNRGVEGRENKRPSMPDLRDSGAIEEDASVIIFLYRAAYYLGKLRYDDMEAERARVEQLEATKNKIELGIDKNRNGEPTIVDAFINVGANALRNADFDRPAAGHW